MQRINGGNIQIIDTKDIFISALMYCIQVYLSTGPGGGSFCQKKRFCRCGAILNLNAFCFGAVPDIMLELIVYGSVPHSGPK